VGAGDGMRLWCLLLSGTDGSVIGSVAVVAMETSCAFSESKLACSCSEEAEAAALVFGTGDRQRADMNNSIGCSSLSLRSKRNALIPSVKAAVRERVRTLRGVMNDKSDDEFVMLRDETIELSKLWL